MLAISLASFITLSSILTIITVFLFIITYQTFFSIYGTPRDERTSSNTSISRISRAVIATTMENPQPRDPPKRSKTKIKSFFIYTTLISSSCFLVSSILITTERILSIEPFWTFGHLEYFSYFMNTLYFIGRMILTSIFIGRLYYTFRESSFYRLSKGSIWCLTVLWSLSCCVGLLSSALYPLSVKFTIIFGTSFLFLDGVLSCVLMYIYVKKLRLLVSKNNENANVKLISLITRYTLLFSICFVSTTLYFVLAIVVSGFARSAFPRGEALRFLSVFLAADSLCNSLSLWLNLSSSKKWYFRLCGAVHDKYNIYFGVSVSTEDLRMTRIHSASPALSPALSSNPRPMDQNTYAETTNTVTVSQVNGVSL
eukprot:28358_1